MYAAVIAALIAAGASVSVAVFSGVHSRQNDLLIKRLDSSLRREEAAEQREAEAETVLARYREPLVAAAFQLQGRIHNIIEEEFLETYMTPASQRSRDAKLSTLYRFGEYFAWTELLRRDIQFMKFREPQETRDVADLLSRIVRELATDEHGQAFMIWPEEQRAMGECLIERDEGTKASMGYASFDEAYESRLIRWFARLATDLDQPAASTSPRLPELRDLLRRLVATLDPDAIRFERWWEQPAPPAVHRSA